MALGVLLEPKSTPRSRLHHIHHPDSVPCGGMSYNPAPLLPPSEYTVADRNTISPQLDPDRNALSSTSPSASSHNSHLQPGKNRRPPKLRAFAEIRRSASTPHMRGVGLADVGALSPTDKRRNKLGYHRTSVACGHCRRRKIRCLIANDDPQGRCSNCIRLKKDCQFYPVEQLPPASESRSGTSTSKHDSGSGAPSASTPSSPRLSVASIRDASDDYSPYNNNLSRSSTQHNYSPLEGGHIGPASEGGMYPPQSYSGYQPRLNEQWAPPPDGYSAPSSSTEESALPGAYWATPEGDPEAMGTYPSVPEGHQQWATPARSMSYGHIEGLQHQQAYPHSPYAAQRLPVRSNTFAYAAHVDPHDRSANAAPLPPTLPSSSSAPHPVYPNFGYQESWPQYAIPDPHMPVPEHQPGYAAQQWYGGQATTRPTSGDDIITAQYPNMPHGYNPNQQTSA